VEGELLAQPESEQGRHPGVDLYEPVGEGVVPGDQGPFDPLSAIGGLVERGQRPHGDRQRPIARLAHRVHVGRSPDPTELALRLRAGRRRRDVDGGQDRSDGHDRPIDLVLVLVPGDGHQHLGLELGLVLPHPADHRSVGEPDAGVLLHPVENPLDGQHLGAGPEALLAEYGLAAAKEQLT
jgi:hypothetical protein